MTDKDCRDRAPEQVDADFHARGHHTDVWGFAACVLHLATGRLPYHGLGMVQIASAMTRGRSPDVPTSLPVWLRQILVDCLQLDVTARPSLLQLRQVGAIAHLVKGGITQLSSVFKKSALTNIANANYGSVDRHMCFVSIAILPVGAANLTDPAYRGSCDELSLYTSFTLPSSAVVTMAR